MKHPHITAQESGAAVLTLGRLIPFFPADESARELIAHSLESFVAGPDHLNWLVFTACNVMREWQGLAELRGLYCSQYRPLDGIEAVSGTVGYRPADVAEQAEKEFFERESRANDQRLNEYRRDFFKLPPSEQQANTALLLTTAAVTVKRLT